MSNFNPGLLDQLRTGPMLLSEQEQQYNNDEMIDNQLRSVLFQIPSSQDPECLNGPTVAAVLQHGGRPGRDRHPARS